MPPRKGANDAAIVERLRRGDSFVAIRTALGCSQATIDRLRAAHGLQLTTTRGNSRRKLEAADLTPMGETVGRRPWVRAVLPREWGAGKVRISYLRDDDGAIVEVVITRKDADG